MVEVENFWYLSSSSFELLCAIECICVKAMCSIEKIAMFLDLVLEGGSGAQCAYILSSENLDSVAQCTGVTECKRLKNNKEDEVVGGHSPVLR